MNEESKLYLLSNVPLKNDYQHTIDFENIESQSQYFDDLISNVELPNDDYSYIRENETINVYAHINSLIHCNYLFYTNGDKRYYAFITNKQYVSDKCTSITFEIDVFQTFMFDYSFGECFIEREHQNRYEKIGDEKLKPIYNLTRENLERGEEFEIKNIESLNDASKSGNIDIDIIWLTVLTKERLSGIYYLQPSINIDSLTPTSTNLFSNNVYAYVVPYIIQNNSASIIIRKYYCQLDIGVGTATVEMINETGMYNLSKEPSVISITASRYAPFRYEIKEVVDGTNRNYYIKIDTLSLTNSHLLAYKAVDNENLINGMYLIDKIPLGSDTEDIEINTNYNINIDDLSIENEKSIEFEPKLMTKDYQYNLLTYGDKEIKIYNENCKNDKIKIKYVNPLSAKGGQCFLISGYNKNSDEINYEQSLYFDGNMYELPLLTDAWLTYLLNNKNSLVTGNATSAISTIGGLLLGFASGGVGLAVAGSTALSYGTQIANQIAQIKDIKNKPDELRNVTNDISIEAIKGMNLKYKKYQIHNQFRERIFNYFYHYGYLAQYFNTPNIKSRYYFNYIKTVGANIISNIDNSYIEQIQSIFDNGVTIWHYRDMKTWHGIGNYNYENVENNIVGGNND